MEENKILEKMALIVKAFDNISTDVQKKVYTDDEKKRAAYALNMCTVSISQIVDYADVNVLEQEYEAILNNLNLEQMPKDEALLNILRQILDTITYFRIQAGEKEMIEKEYQQKMKDAIWNAVPNFGLIVAGGNPVTMGISLASQVGIGYMNYRRSKANSSLEKDRKKWELRKTAIEQLNGLRRELFNTAWRLADTYDFPDEYRLTERQINQYNKILMDQDEIRKYERLESIKSKFDAYPPFWYFIGNAANYIAGDTSLSDKVRKNHEEKALENFKKYEELNKFNILREDQLVASCALEHIDLLMLEKEKIDDKTEKKEIDNKIKKLLEQAVKNSGNAFDILELCAITYLRIEKKDKAENILKILVNEDYNRIINAQILSSIYVYNNNTADYELLASRVDRVYLFPMPEEDEDTEVLKEKFAKEQKEVLKKKYECVLDEYRDKYSIKWNKFTSIFDNNTKYSEEDFLDTKEAKDKRKRQALKTYDDFTKRKNYQQRLANSNYVLHLLDILNEMFSNVFTSAAFEDGKNQKEVTNEILKNITDKRDDINKLQMAMDDKEFSFKEYELSQDINIRSIVGKAFEKIKENAHSKVDELDVNRITCLEGNLREFCIANDLPAPEIAINRGSKSTKIYEHQNEIFSPKLFGNQAIILKEKEEFMSKMVDFVREQMNDINNDDSNISVFLRNTEDFINYFLSIEFTEYPDLEKYSIMVLQDKTHKKIDLIFTTEGIISVVNNHVKNKTPYSEVKRKGDSIELYRGEIKKTRDYEVTSFDANKFYGMIQALGNMFVRNIYKKIKVVHGTVKSKELNQWFKEQEGAMEDGVTRIYAIPKKEILEDIGISLGDELDLERDILQFYEDTQTGNILGLRIVRSDVINLKIRDLLEKHGGLFRVSELASNEEE